MTAPRESYEAGYDPKYGYNRNAFKHKTPVTFVLSKVVRLVTLPVDLAAEAIGHSKEKKQPSPQGFDKIHRRSQEQAEYSGRGNSSDAYVELPEDKADELIRAGHAVPTEDHQATHRLVDEDGAADRDEADWELDEAAFEYSDEKIPVEDSGAIGSFLAAIPGVSSSRKELPFPVILPQRRPRSKTRGFVQAYAPVLAPSGISQDTFLAFLKSLHQASQSSAILNVVQLGAGLAGIYPDIIVACVSQAVQIAAGVAQEMQERWRTNKFLDQANKELFMPRGLYCMIVTYKQTVKGDEYVATETVDMNAAVEGIAKYGSHLTQSKSGGSESEKLSPSNTTDSSGKHSGEFATTKDKMQNRLHLASAASRGESEMPIQCAPLVYPALEAEAYQSKDMGTLAALKSQPKRSSAFVNDYFDRRARMIETTADPDNTLNALAGGKPGFKSKIGDPNDARNTHLITLITGGKIKAEPLGAKRRWEKAQKKEADRIENLKRERAQALARGETIGPIEAKKRFMQESILYLMIVNMPSEAELSKARANIASRKKQD